LADLFLLSHIHKAARGIEAWVFLRNYLFAGADSGRERAAAICSLIGITKLNGGDPEV
jgi:hypothetical protein